MKNALLASVACVAVAALAPAAQAAYVSIWDQTETLGLTVDQYNQITSPAANAAGSGVPIDIVTPTPSNGISNISYSLSGPPSDPTTEFLSFKFDNQINWGSDVYLYRYLTEQGGAYSDLFVIQGLGGTAPDYITFISSDLLTGSIGADARTFGISPLTGAGPTDLGTVAETGDWQFAYDTGVDQYYVASDVDVVPEPSTWAAMGIGFAALGFVGWRRTLRLRPIAG